MFVGLNPSTADAWNDDPTIRRCIGFAKSWDYGGLLMGNLFAFRATNPREILKAHDPVGPENDDWLVKLSKEAALVVGAWGNRGAFMNRGNAVAKMFRLIHYIRLNKSGHPTHPLYLRRELKPTAIKKGD